MVWGSKYLTWLCPLFSWMPFPGNKGRGADNLADGFAVNQRIVQLSRPHKPHQPALEGLGWRPLGHGGALSHPGAPVETCGRLEILVGSETGCSGAFSDSGLFQNHHVRRDERSDVRREGFVVGDLKIVGSGCRFDRTCRCSPSRSAGACRVGRHRQASEAPGHVKDGIRERLSNWATPGSSPRHTPHVPKTATIIIGTNALRPRFMQTHSTARGLRCVSARRGKPCRVLGGQSRAMADALKLSREY